MVSKNCKKTMKTLESNQMEIRLYNSKPASEKAIVKKKDRPSNEEFKFFKKLEKFIEDKNINRITNFAAIVSELPIPISNPDFYRTAFEFMKTYPVEKVYLHVESLGQSAAIAKVQNEEFYYDIIDFLLTGKNTLQLPILSHEYIDSVCRILASIEISNEKSENGLVISAPSAFALTINKLLEFEIENERRVEEKADRLVEIYEQALAAKIDSENGRDLYEKVFNYIMNNEHLSLDYKMKTIFEITKKTIKTPGVTHTGLFMKAIEFYKENKAANISRILIQLLEVHKK